MDEQVSVGQRLYGWARLPRVVSRRLYGWTVQLPPAARRVFEWVRTALRRLPALATVSPLGWLVLAGSVAAWLIGRRLGWIELILGAAAGLLTFALCGLFTVGRTTLRIIVEPERRRLVAGHSTGATVQVTNLARRRLLPVALEVPVGTRVEPFDVPSLAGGGVYTDHFEVATARRGVITVGPATTVRGDPLGLLRRRVSWTGVTELFVHPVTVPLAPLGSGLLRDLEGRTTNDVSMSDLAFHTLRDYVPGDDRRYIHWRSSAKVGSAAPGGKFLVRQFLDTRRTHLLVIVDGDTGAYPNPDHFETAISAGASVAVCAIDEGLDATLLAGGHLAYDATAQRALDACVRAELDTTGLADLVARGIRTAPEATTAVIVTGANPPFADLRRAAARLPSVVVTVVVRVDPSSPAAIAAGPSLTVLTLNRLGELRGLLDSGVGR